MHGKGIAWNVQLNLGHRNSKHSVAKLFSDEKAKNFKWSLQESFLLNPSQRDLSSNLLTLNHNGAVTMRTFFNFAG